MDINVYVFTFDIACGVCLPIVVNMSSQKPILKNSASFIHSFIYSFIDMFTYVICSTPADYTAHSLSNSLSSNGTWYHLSSTATYGQVKTVVLSVSWCTARFHSSAQSLYNCRKWESCRKSDRHFQRRRFLASSLRTVRERLGKQLCLQLCSHHWQDKTK